MVRKVWRGVQHWAGSAGWVSFLNLQLPRVQTFGALEVLRAQHWHPLQPASAGALGTVPSTTSRSHAVCPWAWAQC